MCLLLYVFVMVVSDNFSSDEILGWSEGSEDQRAKEVRCYTVVVMKKTPESESHMPFWFSKFKF